MGEGRRESLVPVARRFTTRFSRRFCQPPAPPTVRRPHCEAPAVEAAAAAVAVLGGLGGGGGGVRSTGSEGGSQHGRRRMCTDGVCACVMHAGALHKRLAARPSGQQAPIRNPLHAAFPFLFVTLPRPPPIHSHLRFPPPPHPPTPHPHLVDQLVEGGEDVVGELDLRYRRVAHGGQADAEPHNALGGGWRGRRVSGGGWLEWDEAWVAGAVRCMGCWLEPGWRMGGENRV